MKRLLTALLVALPLVPAPRLLPSQERGVGISGATAFGAALAGLGTSARVLMIAAHPDDEDTRLITWLSRGRHAEVAYLSLTRGSGGQNLIGNELGEALGALRTEELLAARRVDGASQYFTRAYDFGFSKSADEAFAHWPHDSLLGDVVRVVRRFRPHVLVSVFTGTPADGHGHHQAAGILAREAFDAAADTVRFPRARYGQPWAPAKFYRTRSYWNHEGATFRYDAGRYDPVLGRSYAELAAISRSQHRSQAFGSLEPKGAITGSLRREASRVEAPAAEQERSPFDGVGDTYARLRPLLRTSAERARLDSLVALLAAIPAEADLARPATTVPRLATAHRLTRAIVAARQGRGDPDLPAQVDVEESDDVIWSLATLDERLSRAAALALGLAAEATAPREEIPLGAVAPVRVAVYNRAAQPLRVEAVRVSGPDVVAQRAEGEPAPREIRPDSMATWTVPVRAARVSQPYWLARARRGDLYDAPTGLPDTGPRAAEARLLVRYPGGGPLFETAVPVTYRYADRSRGEINRPVAVVPAVSVTLDQAAGYARAGAPIERALDVTLRSADTAAREVRVSLRLPAGLVADSASRTATLGGYGTVRTVRFTVRGRLPAGSHTVAAVVESGDERFERGHQLIDYEHVRPQRLYREATFAIQAIDVALPPNANVAYVPGVGDNSPAALRQLGIPVTTLDPERVGTTDLSRFTAVVVGPRAYEANDALVRQNAALLDYARRGGTLVVQYGQYEMTRPGIMPYPITLGRPAARVTDETSEVRIVDPAARVLTWPNRIGAADFAGWVQDRSLYMPATHAPEYQAPLSLNDPGEPANRGALLVAPYGKGTYVYTTLAFFRQLPNGVPGAARLFVNLLGAGTAPGPATRGGSR